MEGETIFIVLFVVATAAAILQRLAFSQVIRQVGDPMIELTLTTITA